MTRQEPVHLQLIRYNYFGFNDKMLQIDQYFFLNQTMRCNNRDIVLLISQAKNIKTSEELEHLATLQEVRHHLN